MDDMGTPGPNYPAHRGLKDKRTESQFRNIDTSNVLDLNASRIMKERTGKAKPVPVDPRTLSDMDKHWDSGIHE
jgi:hypothetical protein